MGFRGDGRASNEVSFYLYEPAFETGSLRVERMYAIVDIETTGGYAANNAITEVAIVLHDGNRELKRYETLVRPGMSIPRYVQALTGIDDEMVSGAPSFEEVAPIV